MKVNPTPTKTESDAVAKFIVERVALLAKENSGPARDELINASVSGSVQNPATTTYLANFTTVLNREALALLAANKDVRVRLNVAIVVARVAGNAQNAWLGPTIESLLAADKKEPVVLWGMKAAGSVLPQPGGAPDKLLKAMLAAVKAHPSSGPIADEAYAALQPTALAPSHDSIKFMQDIFELRIKSYASGVPVDPTVDRRPSNFLTAGGAQGMWTLSNPVEQKRTAQLISDLLDSAAKQADVTTASADAREQLVYLINSTAQAVQVVAGNVNNTGLQATARAVRFPLNVPAGQVTAGVKGLTTALRAAFQLPAK